MTSRLSRIILALLGVTAIELGVWATVSPRAFYENFPGGGRHWVSLDGPYNEHLVRDFGGLNLALALVTLAALVKFTPTLVRLAAGAWLVWSVPHFVYHARHLDVLETGDKVANMVTLGLTLAAPALLLLFQSTSKVPPARQ
jgi:hypothetical protein